MSYYHDLIEKAIADYLLSHGVIEPRDARRMARHIIKLTVKDMRIKDLYFIKRKIA